MPSALSAGDLRAVVNWYRDSLGFSLLRETGSSGSEIRSAMLERDNNLIEIVQRKTASAPPSMPDRSYERGIFKVGFWVMDLDALAAELRRKRVNFVHGIVRPPEAAHWTFAVQDPESNVAQFFGH